MCKSLTKVSDAVGELTKTDDVCLIRLHDEQLNKDISKYILKSDEDEDEVLSHQQTDIEQQLFSCSLTVKCLLESHNHSTTSPSSSSCEGVKLPKLDVPSFDGNILNWKTFWDQFCIYVHNHTTLSDSEKLVYLQQSLRDDPTKHSIEGLSQSGECYSEAVDSLKSRYD